jgi:hypothetical protein
MTVPDPKRTFPVSILEVQLGLGTTPVLLPRALKCAPIPSEIVPKLPVGFPSVSMAENIRLWGPVCLNKTKCSPNARGGSSRLWGCYIW